MNFFSMLFYRKNDNLIKSTTCDLFSGDLDWIDWAKSLYLQVCVHQVEPLTEDFKPLSLAARALTHQRSYAEMISQLNPR